MPQPTWAKKRAKARARISSRRSKFEERFEADLKARGVSYDYEKRPLSFTVPPKKKTFDWWFIKSDGSAMVVETKGYWDSRVDETRCVEQNPAIDIRYVFQRDQPICKGSKTMYSDWCRKKGIPFAIGTVPQEWLDE